MLAALAFLLVAQADAPRDAELKAQQALRDGRKLEALEHYERAIRAVADTATKIRLRKAYLDVGWAEPKPPNLREERSLAGHILNERLRLFDKAADRFRNEDKIQAAIMMRRLIVEAVGEKSDRATQEKNKINGLLKRLTGRPDRRDKADVAEILKKRDGAAVLKAGRALLAQGRYRAVVWLCKEMLYGSYAQEHKDASAVLRKEAEARASGDVATAEREDARKVMNDPRFDRLAVARSRHFLFLGPTAFIESISPKERMLLDLAYIFQSDLAAQWLTADGKRVVIYYQETFDFGGGLGGGKLIRIGNRAIRLPIAGMLHYHELGHCIFGKGWLHHGFTEGLADFAAGFTLDSLGQTAASQRFIDNARDQFVRFFLGRAVRYFDIQPYKPSAGFLFSFLPPGEAPFDWSPFRKAFRRMRDQQMGQWPDRQHQLMRYFGYLMAAEYGPKVFDTLHQWGWPVSRRDFSLVPGEAVDLLGEAKQGDFKRARGAIGGAADHYERVLKGQPDGALVPRALYGLLHSAQRAGDTARVDGIRRRLGILDRYKVLGAFHALKKTHHVVLAPETGRIEHDKEFVFRKEVGIWKPAKVRYDGYVDLLKHGWGYPDDACAFALTYVHSDAHQPARLWIGSDDAHAVYVNGTLAEKRPDSRAFVFDDDFADIDLRPGWNRVLIKVSNRTGQWGFLARITDRDGRALALRLSTDDLEARVPRTKPRGWKRIGLIADEFRSLSRSKWHVAVGKFDTQNGRLRPLGTEKIGLWNRFVVDPDKPKDGPANIAWAKSADLAQGPDLELELVVVAAGKKKLFEKFGFTIDGENENDGQSGHTFVLDEAAGKDGAKQQVRCHWYRYDKLLYLQQGVEIPPAELYKLVLRRTGSKWTLTINGVALFDGADAAPLPAAGVGLLTWGKGPLFESARIARLEPK